MLHDLHNVIIYNKSCFTPFSFSRANILPTTNSTYLKTCRYDKDHHPYCPIFLVGDVINWTGYNFQNLATKASAPNDMTSQNKQVFNIVNTWLMFKQQLSG